jgi:PAS domain S-box-containing protein
MPNVVDGRSTRRRRARAKQAQHRAEAVRSAAEVEALLRITAALNAAETEAAMVCASQQGLAALCPADHTSVGLTRGNRLVIGYHQPDGAWAEVVYKIPPAGSITQHVLQTRRPYRSDDLATDPISDHATDSALGFRTQLTVPVVGSDGDVLGVLSLFNKTDGATFAEHDEALVDVVATQLGVALERARARVALAETVEALRASEASFRLLFAGNPHPMWVYDRETGAFLEVNDTAVAAYGYTRDELLGMTIADIRPAEDVARLQDELAQPRPALQKAGQWRHRLKDSRVIDVEITSHTLPFGDRPAALVVAQDVTERNRTEAELRASESELRALFAAMSDVVLVLSAEGRYLKIAPTNPGLLYQPAPDLLGRTIHDALPAPAAAAIQGYIDQALAERRVLHVEYSLAIDDREIWFMGTVSPILEDAVFWVGRDITEERSLRTRLAQSEKLSALGELAAGMAHEINNPLAAVAGTAELALRGELSPELREDLNLIRREAARAGEIVKAVLRFSRQREPSLEPLDLAEVIDEALALRGDRLTSHGVALEWDGAPALQVLGDRDQLLQVFMNLINNAVDAMKGNGGGRLRIAVADLGGRVQACVEDSGPGIPATVLPRIFDPFFTTKPTGEGTGLGLSVSHSIVADHGGELAAENLPGGGARFCLALPIHAPTESLAADERAAQVLIIHPDPMTAQVLAGAVGLVGLGAQIVDGDAEMPACGAVAALVWPGVADSTLATVAAVAPEARLIAAGPVSQDGRVWFAVLPERFGLGDIERALQGIAP